MPEQRYRAGEGSKKVEGNINLYKKIVTNYACFCSATMLTSKTIPDNIENQSEISGCANSSNKFVSIRSR